MPDAQILLDFLERYDNSIDRNDKSLRRLVLGAVNYYYDFIKPNKNYVSPNEEQKQAILKVLNELKSGKFDKIENQDVEIQNMIYTIGNDAGFELKSWFKCLYQALLGTETGPRMGTFISIYGIDNTIKLIEEKIK